MEQDKITDLPTLVDRLAIPMLLTAGLLGFGMSMLKKQMEMLNKMCDGQISVKDVIAGIVSVYTDMIEAKDLEIEDLKHKIAVKESELHSLTTMQEEDARMIQELQDKIKELKSDKKKEKKSVKGEKDAKLQDTEDRPQLSD